MIPAIAMESCTIEKFIDDVNMPLTLYHVCLAKLHLCMNKRTVHKTGDFITVDYNASEQLIKNLEIPQNIKNDLTFMIQHCNMHNGLHLKLPKTLICVRYMLKPNSKLLRFLQTHKNWNSQFERRAFSFVDLMNLIKRFEFHLINILSHTQRQQFFFSHCKVKLLYLHHG